ncbi:MAG: recombination protein RecR [Candidatus Liptonbacteria bacterium]|nr:recombination protein RecR [Candidatus Liptonbacteria bacterium]
MRLPNPIERFVAKLSELPSLGPRQATRLAFYLLRTGENNMRELGDAISGMRSVKPCARCFFVHQNENGLCDICRDPRRAQNVIMVIEKETDLLSLENSGKFNGRYFILGEIAKTGILEEWQKLRLQQLKSFIQKEFGPSTGSTQAKAEEIVLGFNPTSVGDFSASLVARELEPFAKKISRLGRGLPTGGEIEFADDETLGSALERRG